MPRAKPKSYRVAGRNVPVRATSKFQERLATVRQFVSGFDGKAWEDLYLRRPRTAKGKKERSKQLARVSRTFRKLRPYLNRSYKVVRPRSAKSLAAVADYANVPKLKGLRAVPVATEFPQKTKVSVSKKGIVTLKRGKLYREVIYKFPKRPRAHIPKGGKFLTAGEHALAMLESMMPQLKPGIYVLMTRSQLLLPIRADKGALLQKMRAFVFAYEKIAPDFMQQVIGVKWLAHSAATSQKRLKELEAARTEAKRRRIDSKRINMERTARKLGRISKRARAVGRQ